MTAQEWWNTVLNQGQRTLIMHQYKFPKRQTAEAPKKAYSDLQVETRNKISQIFQENYFHKYVLVENGG